MVTSRVCNKCLYPINEPICASCSINQVDIWLNKQDIDSLVGKKIKDRLQRLSSEIDTLDEIKNHLLKDAEISYMGCIVCKEKMLAVCSYCINKKIEEILKNSLHSKRSLRNFQEIFHKNSYGDIYGPEKDIRRYT